MAIDIILVTMLILASLVAAMTARLLRSAIALAVTSALLSVIMYRLDSPLAAVFELSVCAGLIPAIFISAIGLTRRLDPEGLLARKRDRLKRYWYLPVIVIALAAILSQMHLSLDFVLPAAAGPDDARTVMWNLRHIDLLGQVVVLLGGAFAVVVLLKEARHE